MVDVNELKKKFPAKRQSAGKRASKAAVRAIQLEYEAKRAELKGGAPHLARGPLFYGIVILFLVAIGSMVVPRIMNGTLTLGRRNIDRKALQARKAMTSLSVALGRYRFHVGAFPTTEEGLEVLAFRRPNEIRRIRKAHPGWDGPYVDHIVNDPWGNAYVYETRPEGGNPILYSKGPNGRAGDDDDVLPEQSAFDNAFRDTTWTNQWAPCELRGVVVAPDEATKRKVQQDMKKYDR